MGRCAQTTLQMSIWASSSGVRRQDCFLRWHPGERQAMHTWQHEEVGVGRRGWAEPVLGRERWPDLTLPQPDSVDSWAASPLLAGVPYHTNERRARASRSGGGGGREGRRERNDCGGGARVWTFGDVLVCRGPAHLGNRGPSLWTIWSHPHQLPELSASRAWGSHSRRGDMSSSGDLRDPVKCGGGSKRRDSLRTPICKP